MIEQAWTLLSTFGALIATIAFFDARSDLRALHNHTNGRRIIASGYMRTEALIGTVQGLLLVLGIGPLMDPAPVPLNPFVADLMLVNLLLVAMTVLNYRDRLRVRKALHPPPETR